MKLLRKISGILVFCLISGPPVLGQIPTNIDPLQKEEPVRLYQQPEYIIPILTLFVLLIGFYMWRSRKRKK